VIECEALTDYATIQLAGTAPNGSVTITRKYGTTGPEPIRLGAINNTTGGFVVDDTEAPIGEEVTYRTNVLLANRTIQQNFVRTPIFTYGAQSWTAGTSRTLSTASGYGAFTSNPGGTGAGISGRTIGEVAVAPLTPDTVYMITADVRIHTPDLWTWQDVRDYGTWQDIKDDFDNWLEVRQSALTLTAPDVFSALYVSLATGVTEHVAPVKVIDILMSANNTWFTFAAFITMPSAIPPTARLRLLHGTQTREYAVAWDFNRVQVQPVPSASLPQGRLFYIDGDTPEPTRPLYAIEPDGTWEISTNDSSIAWTGTPGNSASTFTGPSQMWTESTCQLAVPENLPCDPVIISDPINSRLGAWGGLIGIGSNTFAARIGLSSVIERPDLVPTTMARAWENNEIALLTETLMQRQQMIQVLKSGRVMMLRNPDPAYPESMWYIAIGDVTEARVEGDARRPERIFSFPFTRVARPSGLSEAGITNTWSLIRDNFTWAELAADRTWLDTMIDPVDA
jgi:hypothetical protein